MNKLLPLALAALCLATPASAQITAFQHVILVIQENRTPETRRPASPAHQFLFGATSAPSANDDRSGIFAAEETKSG